MSMVKAVALDFDGTLVSRDILDVVCEIVGKEKESAQLSREFQQGLRPGLSALITRINFLQGVTQSQIQAKIEKNPYLMPGAKELISYLKAHDVITILNSGNIKPVLIAYQQILGLSYVVGPEPTMHGDVIEGVSERSFSGQNFKLDGVKTILAQQHIQPAEVLAVGDSPADAQVFAFAGATIAINPKGGIEKVADYVIHNDLREAIKIIEPLTQRT